ncbi:MAG: MerR family transcriptional regulator [Oligoflexia bacterium]|nr:MerR family transcriptional regulator [Oligoflexia bacterium]
MDELIPLVSEKQDQVSDAADIEMSSSSIIQSEGDGDNKDPIIDLGEIARMIPDKMAYKIGEVAELAGLKTYVLRYWESEFDALNPQKSAFNQRMYSRRDVETVLLIKKLLYDEKFSIAGAKKKINELRRELKVEKQWIEVSDRVELATIRISELVTEINSLKSLFN